MNQKTHYVPNKDGWELALKQTYDANRLEPGRRPIAIVPGYGMNAFIFGFHPTGVPMETYWAQEGFEVWSLNLRAQGGSRRLGGSRTYGFYDAGVTDLTCAFDYIVEHTQTRTDRVDGIGVSLGGTYLYVYLAFLQKKNRLGALVSMGAPLRWEDPHPILKHLTHFPNLLGQMKFRGTRRLAQVALPVLKHIPSFLNLYMHTDIIDTSKMGEMVHTVEDPNPELNESIAGWIQAKDLFVEDLNMTDRLSRADNPLLIVLANADGIVPEGTTLSAYHTMASPVKDVLRVGTEAVPIAHADLFISEISQEWVFEPIAQWLIAHNKPSSAAKARKRKATGKKAAPKKKKKASPKATPRPKTKSRKPSG